MPRTYTDDVAAALPSSIDGPLEVADAADHDSYIKIDPALAKITAAGDARPTRRINTGLVKTIGTSAAGTLGSALACRQVATGIDAGYYAFPFAVPSDMDLTQPSSIFILIAPAANSALTSVAVRTEIVAGYTKDGQSSPHSTTVTYDFTVPDSWQSGAAELVLVDDGNGRTFAGNVFESGDVLGLRARLVRSAAQDTFDQSVKLATGLIFEYTAKEM